MIRTGLWIELEAVIGFIVGLGLASLLGQRTVPVILMIVLEIILTPLSSPSTNRPPVEPAAFDCRRCHGPLDTGGPSRVRRRWRRSGWRTGESLAGAGVGHLGRLGHRRVARGLDGSRSMADDDERRLGHTESRGDWPVTVTFAEPSRSACPTKGTSRYSVCGSVSTRAPGTSSAGRFGCDQ